MFEDNEYSMNKCLTPELFISAIFMTWEIGREVGNNEYFPSCAFLGIQTQLLKFSLNSNWSIDKLFFFWSSGSLCNSCRYEFRIKSKCPKSGCARGWRQMPGQYFMKIVSCRYIWNPPVHIQLEHKTRKKIDRKSYEKQKFLKAAPCAQFRFT